MKLAVIGSRSFEDKQRLFEVLDKNYNIIKLIVSGGAAGADSLGVVWAQERGVPYLVFPARWRDLEGNYDKGAGFRRNIKIIENCDKVLAFMQRGGSRGTQHSIDIAKRLKKEVTLIEFDLPPEPKDISSISLGQTTHKTEPAGQKDCATETPAPTVSAPTVLPADIEL